MSIFAGKGKVPDPKEPVMTYRENPPMEDRGIAVTDTPPEGATPERAEQYAADIDRAYEGR